MSTSPGLPTLYHIVDIRKKRYLVTVLYLETARDVIESCDVPSDMAIYTNDKTVRSVLKPDENFFLFCIKIAELKHEMSQIRDGVIK